MDPPNIPESTMTKPDFIIAGTQKAGTTWLKDHLAAHPHVAMVKGTPHYFDRGWKSGNEAAYRALFTPGNGQIAGEKSTEYFDVIDTVGIAQRMRALAPNVKLIVILRDPVKRALSAFDHVITSGVMAIPRDPVETLFSDTHAHGFVARGDYMAQIDAFASVFPPEQMLFLIFEEDIVANPAEALRKTQAFLGIDPLPAPANAAEAVNKRRLSPLAVTLSHALYRVPFARGVIRRLDRFNPAKPYKTEWPDGVRERLAKIYTEPNARLFDHLGRRIPSWTEAS